MMHMRGYRGGSFCSFLLGEGREKERGRGSREEKRKEGGKEGGGGRGQREKGEG